MDRHDCLPGVQRRFRQYVDHLFAVAIPCRDLSILNVATPLPVARQIMAVDKTKISIPASFFQHFLPKSWLF
jgi:hypothetical protein